MKSDNRWTSRPDPVVHPIGIVLKAGRVFRLHPEFASIRGSNAVVIAILLGGRLRGPILEFPVLLAFGQILEGGRGRGGARTREMCLGRLQTCAAEELNVEAEARIK